jgi:hypothetical protein
MGRPSNSKYTSTKWWARRQVYDGELAGPLISGDYSMTSVDLEEIIAVRGTQTPLVGLSRAAFGLCIMKKKAVRINLRSGESIEPDPG